MPNSTPSVPSSLTARESSQEVHDGEFQRNRPDCRGRPYCRVLSASGNGDAPSSLSLDSLPLVVVRQYAARSRPFCQRQRQSATSSVDRPFFYSNRRQLV